MREMLTCDPSAIRFRAIHVAERNHMYIHTVRVVCVLAVRAVLTDVFFLLFSLWKKKCFYFFMDSLLLLVVVIVFISFESIGGESAYDRLVTLQFLCVDTIL